MVSTSNAQDKKNIGWLSKVFSKGHHVDTTNMHELADESIVQGVPTQKIDALLESVNSASQQVRNFYITFLLVGFYIAMIVWSTTDVMLLKDTPVELPILDVKLSITGFYLFAPFFYLLLHFNLLLQLALLSDKIHRFDDAVTSFDEADVREYYYTRLFSFPFTQVLIGRRHFWFLKFLLTLMVWITIIWLPLGLLIGLQVGFLAYHDVNILFWQRFAIGLDLIFLAIFWPVIRSRDGNGFAWITQIFRNIIPSLMVFSSPIRIWIGWWLPIPHEIKQSKVYLALKQYSQLKFSGKLFLESNVIIITGVTVIIFSWGVAVLPDSKNESVMAKIVPEKWLTDEPLSDKNKEGKPYFRLTEYLFDKIYLQNPDGAIQTKDSIFNRNLRIREKLLIANKLKAEEEADITSESVEKREAALKKVEGLILSGRDFRYADLSEARLPKVDFVGANDNPSDISYANLQSIILTKARMNGTKLQGVDLSGAKLQGADFYEAELQGVDLQMAELQGAVLFGAKLRGADLRKAELQGADLSFAELQGAKLYRVILQGAFLVLTKFQGADLSFAELQGAKLYRAVLQGAVLTGAKFQGADLRKAEFQGAVLSWAELQGVDLHRAELQGVDLHRAKLQGAVLINANLTLSDISNAQFTPLTDQELVSLLDKMSESIDDIKLRNQVKKILSERTQKPATLPNAMGEYIWSNKPYGDVVHTILNGFGNELKGAKNKSEHQSELFVYLIKLSCQDPSIAQDIINNRIVKKDYSFGSNLSQCLLSLKDKKNQSDHLVCPALSLIDEDIVTSLKERAAEKDSDNVIQTTFECKTEYSDKL